MGRAISKLLKIALTQKASCILVYASILALLDAGLLYACASKEGVLRIDDGTGLLNNYGLISTLIGNAFIPFLVKLYYDEARSVLNTGEMQNCPQVRASAFRSTKMLMLSGKAKACLLLFAFVGTAAWLSNTSFHVLGMAESHWGRPVFDSVDHPASFIANRINNFYTWVVLLPICAHVCVFTTYQIVSAMKAAVLGRVAKFDLLNQDKNGGFSSLDRSQVFLNILIAILYVQISAHTGTFKLNLEHISAYAAATAFLIFGNAVILGDAYSSLKKLKNRIVDDFKEKAYKSDEQSFEILKYYYDHHSKKFGELNLAIKTVAVVTSAVLKGMPLLSSVIDRITLAT